MGDFESLATGYFGLIGVCVAGRPDRVGIVRKLRWGYTLKKDAPGAYRLDMTEARFKNSRFYVSWSSCHPTHLQTLTHIHHSHASQGPSVTSVSALIAPVLDSYVELISFDFDDKPYVFCEKRDNNRCLTSSAWSAYCKVPHISFRHHTRNALYLPCLSILRASLRSGAVLRVLQKCKRTSDQAAIILGCALHAHVMDLLLAG